ncbi:MAG: MAPEG family protein [Candidatus Omnitrophica bacterium]|nr:MAPEG family protein [Candidatus Omnitrophota bacterium]
MTIAYLCIVISIFIPIGCAAYAKLSTKGYDNANPRAFLKTLQGAGQRADYAQQNFYETFPAFAVGVVVAHQMQAAQAVIDGAAVTYVVARILYAVFYIKNFSTARSFAWTAALVSTLTLYFIGI